MAEMKTIISAVEGVIRGKVSAGEMILNDYRLIIEDIEGGHRLTAIRGSEVQSIDIMDGDGFAPTIDIKHNLVPDTDNGGAQIFINGYEITITDKNGSETITLQDGRTGARGYAGTSSNVKLEQQDDGVQITSTVTYGGAQPTVPTVTTAFVKNGKTPVKGKDYFTEEEIHNIAKAASEKIGVEVVETGNAVAIDPNVGAQIKIVTDLKYSSEGYTHAEIRHAGKNVLPINEIFDEMVSSGGAVYTRNKDGSIAVSGTPSALSIASSRRFSLPEGKYAFSGAPSGSALLNCDMFILDSIGNIVARSFDGTDQSLFELAETTEIYFSMRIAAGEINTIFYPQIECGTEITAFETPDVKSHNVEFGRTVHGGSYDWASGVLTVTHDADGMLDTPEKLTYDALEIIAFAGVNTIISMSGEAHVSYMIKLDTVLNEHSNRLRALENPEINLPHLYLTGSMLGISKDNAVTLRYEYDGMIGECTLKWQGTSSIKYPKKNFTIKFDRGFEAKKGWGTENKYCLKANYIDASHARNIIGATIWGQMVKSRAETIGNISNLPNGGAIDGFPIIVCLNDEIIGLYTMNIPKDEWMLGMGSGEKECILSALGSSAAGPEAFRSLETTFDDTIGFEIEYITDESDATWAMNSLNAIIQKVIDYSNSKIFDATIFDALDLHSAIDWYIFNAVFAAFDNIIKNYLLSTFDGEKWFFTQYDLDSIMGMWWDGNNPKMLPSDTNQGLRQFQRNSNGLSILLTDQKFTEIKARYAELRESVLSTHNVSSVISNFIGKIPENAYDVDIMIWPEIPQSSASNADQMRDWYEQRLKIVDAEMEYSEIPIASADVKGGVKVGKGLSMEGETLNAEITKEDIDELYEGIDEQSPVPIIFDTDYGGDCDDAHAVRILAYYESIGQVGIVCVSSTSGNTLNASAIHAALEYDGVSDVPVSLTYPPYTNAPSVYNILAQYPHEIHTPVDTYGEETYRKVLSALDKKAVLVFTGKFGNLSRLLDSQPDKYSELKGVDLVRAKVEKVYIMGGGFPDSVAVMGDKGAVVNGVKVPGAEPNFASSGIDAVNNVIQNCPVPIIFCGWEVGDKIKCGGGIADKLPEKDIMIEAMRIHSGEAMVAAGRFGWDPITTAIACLGDTRKHGYDLVRGTVNLNTTNCTNTFTEDENGNHYYVKLRYDPDYYRININNILSKNNWGGMRNTDKWRHYLEPSVACSGLGISQNSLTFDTAAPVQLRATAAPVDCSEPVVWMSSDYAVAEVNVSGIVTPIGNGEAIITAHCGKKGVACVITVSAFSEEEENDGLVYQIKDKEFTGDAAQSIRTGYALWQDDQSFTVAVDVTPGTQPSGGGCIWWAENSTKNEDNSTVTAGMALDTWKTGLGEWYVELCKGKSSETVRELTGVSNNETRRTVFIVTHATGSGAYNIIAKTLGETAVEKTIEAGYFTTGTSATLDIGASDFGKARPFVGTMHDFSLYDRVLSADEITAYMNAVN